MDIVIRSRDGQADMLRSNEINGVVPAEFRGDG